MSERIVEIIIGSAYVASNGRFFAADIYKGNYYKIMENNTLKTVPLVSRDYERVVAQYEECVKNNQKITSAYELNARAHHNFDIPKITADPEAAEKEWYIRTHPQVVEVPKVEESKKGIFKRREKKNISIKCLKCGAVNTKEQKYCGECGNKLVSAEEEVLEASKDVESLIDDNENKKEIPSKEPEVAEQDFLEDEVIETEQALEPENKEQEAEPETKKGKRKEKKAKKTKQKEETSDKEDDTPIKAPKKRAGRVFLLVLLILILLAGAGAGVYLYLFGGFEGVIYNADKQTVVEVVEPEVPTVVEEENTSFVVIKLKNNLALGQKITEADVEGTILSKEQFEKYNKVSTYIDKNGEQKEEILLLWEEKDQVIGKYATRELTSGSILYDTSITSEHVVADKTFVDVEIDGEGNTVEVESNVLPGNTRIQIVAIVQTDGAEPSQVLLSEMILQDRSLESIFNSAGQDILELLSTEKTATDTEVETENTQAGE